MERFYPFFEGPYGYLEPTQSKREELLELIALVYAVMFLGYVLRQQEDPQKQWEDGMLVGRMAQKKKRWRWREVQGWDWRLIIESDLGKKQKLGKTGLTPPELFRLGATVPMI